MACFRRFLRHIKTRRPNKLEENLLGHIWLVSGVLRHASGDARERTRASGRAGTDEHQQNKTGPHMQAGLMVLLLCRCFAASVSVKDRIYPLQVKIYNHAVVFPCFYFYHFRYIVA